jgi:PleD family two-component response regulator
MPVEKRVAAAGAEPRIAAAFPGGFLKHSRLASAVMRILVIDDEATLASFVERSLRAEGHAVTVAHDGLTGAGPGADG